MKFGFRAISPVVATTLLIIIAVVTAVVLYMWVNGTVTRQPTEQARLQQAIKIEAVNITGGKIYNVTVRNVGDISLPAGTISTLYVIDAATGNVIEQVDVASNQTTTLKPGDVLTISLPNGIDVSGYSAVIVKVVTKDGIEATYLVPVR